MLNSLQHPVRRPTVRVEGWILKQVQDDGKARLEAEGFFVLRKPKLRNLRTFGRTFRPNGPAQPFPLDLPLLRQIVADGDRRDPAFAHGVADLVEAEDHVSRRIEAGDAGALVAVDKDAAGLARKLRSDLP